LRSNGVKDFNAYFTMHPEEVVRCAGLVKVIDVNKVTLDLFGATSNQEMYKNLATMVPSDNFDYIRNEMVLIAEGAK
jgi:hypothetical protein